MGVIRGHRPLQFLAEPEMVSLQQGQEALQGAGFHVSRQRHRFDAFSRQVEQLPPDVSLELKAIEPNVTDEDKVYRTAAVMEYFSSASRPTAVLTLNDMAALRTMAILREMALRVPDDIAVVGFDDILTSAYASCPLTTIRQPTERMGSCAAELLFGRIMHDQENTPTDWPAIRKLPCEMIIRRSCGCKE